MSSSCSGKPKHNIFSPVLFSNSSCVIALSFNR